MRETNDQNGVTPADYEKIRAVFEPMRDKFAKLAASLPADARPAVRFAMRGSEA